MSFREVRLPKVYVPNKSFHDFSGATKFGDIVFLTEGRLPNRYQANDLARILATKMEEAEKYDYLLISGPTSVNCIAASILAYRFGRVNYLIYDPNSGVYSSRTIVLDHQYAREIINS